MATKKEISSFFNYLGVEPRLETISDRIKVQKLVYLAEVFGMNTGFSFTWYTYGPYSPTLTKVMFDGTNGKSSNLASSSKDQKKIDEMKKFLGEDINYSEKLELIASLHYVLAVAKKAGATENEALDLFYDEKQHFTETQVKKYLPRVKQLLK